MPLVPVPGPTQIAAFAQRIRKEKQRKATAPQLVLSYADQDPWLTGASFNVRISVGVINAGKRAASEVAIHVPSLTWCPDGGNSQPDASGAWSLALADNAGKMHREPQKFAPAERRYAWVAQVEKDSLRFIGGPKAVVIFKDQGILKVGAVLSWTDPAEAAAPYADEYEIEIRWLKRPPVPGSGFEVKLGLVGV